ncbi:hypothetical protein [Pelodictyon phaeoclathratiforme]|jgi:hypothetical protein|uniref:Uncharacterized protein n=1 Tax=Pelodictyon phaeoclathratiforme (strain DSM 5477 / BU-1) TaxID=324925 RepID=B4SEE4_PELPB|nr:hypothetical protein [Pelodictyon phaeoclathratiforme]ACF44563.1 conserved hypothetical protein [Pelodictyon phaeoclathratiforme BU-1]MBV5289018.1 hypothetical protein [Pelodictyon phaeoclathratiforme]
MLQKLFMNKVWTVFTLFTISLALYGIDFSIYGNLREISASFLGNLAFLPIYIIVVTLLFERVLRERERKSVMRKLNMVIGVFFSEFGNHLLKELSVHVVESEELKQRLHMNGSWKKQDFDEALDYLRQNNQKISIDSDALPSLKQFMTGKRSFLLSLLENQNLLEHENFTDLLWAAFHITEELEARKSFDRIPPSDKEHINGDIRRVFGHLIREWILYMQHLKEDYPYLFSLAVRLNPMIDSPDPVVYSEHS